MMKPIVLALALILASGMAGIGTAGAANNQHGHTGQSERFRVRVPPPYVHVPGEAPETPLRVDRTERPLRRIVPRDQLPGFTGPVGSMKKSN